MRKLIIFLLCSLVSPAFSYAAGTAAGDQVPSSDATALRHLGWSMGAAVGINAIEFKTDDVTHVLAGIQDALQGKVPDSDIRALDVLMSKLVESRKAVLQASLSSRAEVLDEALAREIAGNDSIIQRPSGLAYQILKVSAPKSRTTSPVRIRYSGRLADGHVFTSLRGPVEAVISIVDMPPWLDEGLALIGPGGKIRLFVPAKLAGDGKFFPGAPAVYDIDRLD